MITVELNETAETRLRVDAQAKGVPVEAYAKELLEGILMPVPHPQLRNGAPETIDDEDDPIPTLEGYVPRLSKDELYK